MISFKKIVLAVVPLALLTLSAREASAQETLVSTWNDGVSVHSSQTGQLIRRIGYPADGLTNATGMLIVGDGLYVAAFGSKRIVRFRYSDGQLDQGFNANAFDPDLNRAEQPTQVILGPDSNIWVLTRRTILKMNPNTGAIIGNVLAREERFHDALGMAFGSDGKLYVHDWQDSKIYRVNTGTGRVEGTVVQRGGSAGMLKIGGMTIGPNGNLFVTDYDGDKVQEFSLTGDFIRTFASGGGLDRAYQLTFAPWGNLLVMDDTWKGVREYQGLNGSNPGAFVRNFARIPHPRKFAFSQPAARLESFAAIPTSFVSGDTVNLTCRLTAPALVATDVLLASSNSAIVPVPVTMRIPAGQRQAMISVLAGTIALSTEVTLTAYLGGQSFSARVNALARIAQVTLNPTECSFGTTVTGQVILNKAAPTGGLSVSLRSSNGGVATVPSSVIVPAGQTQTTFSVTPKSIATRNTTQIRATALASFAEATLTVNPLLAITAVLASPSSLRGGQVTRITLRTNVPATTATNLTISYSPAGLAEPNSLTRITLPSGASEASFDVRTLSVTARKTLKVTVAGAGSKSVNVTLNP